jgi:hypothetical protein
MRLWISLAGVLPLVIVFILMVYNGNGKLNYPGCGKENSPTRMKKKSPSCTVVDTTHTTRMDSNDTYECIPNHTETQEAGYGNSGN